MLLADFADTSVSNSVGVPEKTHFSPLRPKSIWIRSYADCIENEYYLARIHCLQFLCQYLNLFTQGKIAERKIPRKFHCWLKGRGFDIALLLSRYSDGNILFLDDESSIYMMRSNPEFPHEKSGLFRAETPAEKLFWFSKDKYALICPIYGIDLIKKVTVITSVQIRNINPAREEEKEVALPLHKQIQDQGFPCSFGYAGFDLAAKKYPQVLNDFCAGLKVVLTEGIPDLFSGLLFYGSDPNTIVLTAGSPFNSARKQDLELLKKCSELVLIFDLDDAGYQGRISVADQARKVGIGTIKYLPLPPIKGKNSAACPNKVDLNDCLKFYNDLNTKKEKSDFFNDFISLTNAQIIEPAIGG